MIIGLDVGGTHTDVVLLDKKGPVKHIKVKTNREDLFHTVLEGLEKITEGIDPDNIIRIVLSTTLTTNAIVQDKVHKVGMIVSGGPGINPEFYRTNKYYETISGSIDHRGREIELIDEEEIINISKKFKNQGIHHVGIVGKFSTRNPIHELKIQKIIKDSFKMIFLGHQISGNLNFPRRIATTYLNAAVYPLHKEFFEAVRNSLNTKGLHIPIHILKADGGTMGIESSIEFPGQTIFSGPAASIMGALATAPSDEDIIILDIGGTTTDIAVLIDRAPVLEPLGIQLGEYKTLIRALKTKSVGIGGDSHVKVKHGEFIIGPERKGPAMAYEGPFPTPTDALFVLGKLNDGNLKKATSGIKSIARKLGISIQEAAEQIFEKASRMILHEAEKVVEEINSKPVYTIHEFLEGYVVNPKKIMVLGGPAKEFAINFEKISDYSVGIVPEWQVANAIGAGLARTSCEVTLFADTERKVIMAPEEKFIESVQGNYSIEEAVVKANDLLKQKAMNNGSKPEDFEMEILEKLEFNMVRGFSTVGKNYRVKVQVKPGLVHGYEPIKD